MTRLIRTLMMMALVLAAAQALAADVIEVTSPTFGTLADGRKAQLFILRNSKGASAEITNYGGIMVSIKMPDRDGKIGPVILGHDSLQGYLGGDSVFGAIIGRYANRIAGGKFKLNGKEFAVTLNSGANHIHGGRVGFNKVLWDAKTGTGAEGPFVELSYVSKDGEEGYPGTLAVKAVYTLTEANEIKLAMTATTDKDTVINLTNHAYFNLAGPGNGDILKNRVQINGNKIAVAGRGLIPTGEVRAVKGTPFDFTQPVALGERLKADDEQIRLGGGYDIAFMSDKPAGELGLLARVADPASGRVLEVFSTAPGVQFYTCSFLNARGANAAKFRGTFCLEPGLPADAPNHPEFPTATLKAGETYKHTIVYRFSVEK